MPRLMQSCDRCTAEIRLSCRNFSRRSEPDYDRVDYILHLISSASSIGSSDDGSSSIATDTTERSSLCSLAGSKILSAFEPDKIGIPTPEFMGGGDCCNLRCDESGDCEDPHLLAKFRSCLLKRLSHCEKMSCPSASQKIPRASICHQRAS